MFLVIFVAKRPAKENIEKFLQAEYTLHGPKLFAFLFGQKIATGIEENTQFWFDALASAFSGKLFYFEIQSTNDLFLSSGKNHS